MSGQPLRYPLLDKFYQQYLDDENSAEFIRQVSGVYNIGSLCRLARAGKVISRRASVLMLGFLGSYAENEVLGHALNDGDRAVRMLADNGIRDLWGRQGSVEHQSGIRKLYQMISRNQLHDAIELANRLLAQDETLCEAWNQRAIALCAEGDFVGAIEDCCQTLNYNRFHFPAAIGMAHCCLQLDDVSGALSAFRLALKINPDLEGVRNHIHQLERASEN